MLSFYNVLIFDVLGVSYSESLREKNYTFGVLFCKTIEGEGLERRRSGWPEEEVRDDNSLLVFLYLLNV